MMELRGYILFIVLGQAAFLAFVIWSYVKEYKGKFALTGRYRVATIAGIVVASLFLSALLTVVFLLLLGRI